MYIRVNKLNTRSSIIQLYDQIECQLRKYFCRNMGWLWRKIWERKCTPCIWVKRGFLYNAWRWKLCLILLHQDARYMGWNSVRFSNPKVYMWQVYVWSREKAEQGKRKRKIIWGSYGTRHCFLYHKNTNSCLQTHSNSWYCISSYFWRWTTKSNLSNEETNTRGCSIPNLRVKHERNDDWA